MEAIENAEKDKKAFLQNWEPKTNSVVAEIIPVKKNPVKAISSYLPGGQQFEDGRLYWSRRCFLDVNIWILGDSMLRKVSKIKVKFKCR